ncbi:sigma-54-dependent Fis family transcriptional regulator [Thalassotalea sp. M1531]|uniref:Sigma-54-dependent Fis family transcriptional regulator n=1 Tax=Thalassotalea algicola TaxID=2716224 RepID=A0A7Y0LEN5_9GAMM|nr:sigma-54 dependent transcriptional regulator [Thalassotalea algicola]NMP33114.1 sigma-54-dependent Fis family transcriptional regulator [Thalassotalea algicola]
MSNETISVLVVEDDHEQRQLVCEMLAANNFQIYSADCVEQAILVLKESPVDVVFSDWKLGTLTGLDLLNYVRKNLPETGFVIATAYGTISHAVEALQRGADDYLPKPFQRQALMLTVEKAHKAKLLRNQNRQLQAQLSEQKQLVGLVGKAPCMQKVYQRIDKVSATSATVLILGESGTGKELAARALHEKSNRANQKFVAINCGAVAESLAEAELFGAEKGAYTGADKTKIGKFEAANGGTIFLDEIGELSPSLQAHLLRFLQEGTITRLGSHTDIQLDVRVIAATHRDLQTQVANGDFREDLFYRLNVVPIDMPPLRERQEDIALLSEHFLKSHAKQHGCELIKLSEQAYRKLFDYHWPGNVRELSNRIERFVLLNDEEELTHLPSVGKIQANNEKLPNVSFPDIGYNWDDFERFCLEQALENQQGNKTKAAKYLSMSYKAFLYRLEKYQIS